jgi:cell division protease FtsH
MIDEEVKKIFDEASAKCEEILTQHADELRDIAEYLLEHETMEAEEFNYYFEHHAFMPVPPRELRKIREDKTIERPAKKISMNDGEEIPAEEAPAAETPAAEPPQEENKDDKAE